jgi:hypothetical protein
MLKSFPPSEENNNIINYVLDISNCLSNLKYLTSNSVSDLYITVKNLLEIFIVNRWIDAEHTFIDLSEDLREAGENELQLTMLIYLIANVIIPVLLHFFMDDGEHFINNFSDETDAIIGYLLSQIIVLLTAH